MKYLIVLLCLLPLSIMSQEHDGKDLFKSYCKACHSLDKRLVGPALKGVESRRSKDWIVNFVKGSQAMIAAGDSTGMDLFKEFNQIPMPDQNLDDDQINSILAYIKESSKVKPAEANPIKRPQVVYSKLHNPLRFSNYFFWIPFTVCVLLFIAFLYFKTIAADLEHE